jgi:predicted alpha/beta-fold hydrolase
MIAVGYSLGANMLLKYLGEEGSAAPFLAACAISAPIDLAATTGRFEAPRNRLYQRYILSRLKAETLAAPASALDARERRAVVAARSIRRFDEVFIAPRNGFAGAGDYYERCKALRYLAGIAVPTLLIHARDDPWIPAAAYLEYDWRRNPNLTPLLPASGGHVGFHGRGDASAWHDRAMAAFVASC